MTKDDKKMKTATTRLLVSMALAAQAGAAAAQQTAPAPASLAQWECRFCTYPKADYGEVGIGVVGASADSYAFGRYTGLRRSTNLGLDISLRSVDAQGYSDLYATDLGLPYRAVEYEGGRQGVAKLKLHYAERPFHVLDGAVTPFGGAGSSALLLPQGWQPGVTTGGMAALAGSLHDVKIASNRTRIGFGMALVPARDWEVGVNVRQETREGTKRIAGSFFFNAAQLVAPVDYSTDEIEAYASYAASDWQVRFAYQGSTFSDRKDSLRWDNPFAEVMPGATVGQLGLPPDNQFHQVSAAGAYQFTDRTRLTAQLALGRMEQDEKFLPATVNGALAPVALPRASLQGRVDTTRADVKLVSTLADKWGVSAAYSYDDRNNKTPQSLFGWVTTDMLVATPRVNPTYDYTRSLYKVSTDYRFTPRTKGTVGVDHDEQQRSNQEVAKTTEDTLWVKYAMRTIDRVDVTLDYARGRRDGSAYQPVAQIDPPENPVLRKYNMADRDRELVGLRMAAMPSDDVTVGIDLNRSREEYWNSSVGLTYARRYGLGSNAALRLAADTSVHLYYGIEQIKSQQAGAQTFGTPADWFAENVDKVETAGLGFRHAIVRNRLDVGADLTTSHSTGEGRVMVTTSDPRFPAVTSDLVSFKVYGSYRLNTGLAVQASVWRERFSSRNWALDGVGAATLPNVLTLGEASPNYTANVASVTLRYRF